MKFISSKLDLYPDNTILLGYRGSIAHGTYTPEYGPNAHDDVDLMGIALAPLNTYTGFGKFEQHEFMGDDENGITWDSVVYELRKAVRLLLGGNPNVLNILWLPDDMYLIRTECGDSLIKNRDIFSSKEAYYSFVGYAKGQLHRMTHTSGKRLGAKRRDLVIKFGYDCKNAGHLIRLLRMGVEFLETGELKVVRDDAQELIAIKKGEKDLGWIYDEADRLFKLADSALAKSSLPDKPDYRKAEDLVSGMLARYIKGEL